MGRCCRRVALNMSHRTYSAEFIGRQKLQIGFKAPTTHHAFLTVI